MSVTTELHDYYHQPHNYNHHDGTVAAVVVIDVVIVVGVIVVVDVVNACVFWASRSRGSFLKLRKQTWFRFQGLVSYSDFSY